jgi:hypothetical protein
LIVLGAVGVWRLVQAWSGGRRFVWSKLRFESPVGIDEIESFANERVDSGVNERAGSDANEPVDC